MLSTRNLPLQKGLKKKLSPKYIGPFSIVEKLALGHAYRLDLPPEYKDIHHTFHISLLQNFQNDKTNREKTHILPFRIAQGQKKLKGYFVIDCKKETCNSLYIFSIPIRLKILEFTNTNLKTAIHSFKTTSHV